MSIVDDALASLATAVPDLILTTTFLPPAEELKLRHHLRQSPNTSYVQVIALPAFDAASIPAEDASASGRVLPFRRQGFAPRLNPDLLRQHVHEYLQQANAGRLALENGRGRLAAAPSSNGQLQLLDGPPPASNRPDVVLAKPEEVEAVTTGLRLPADRRRASRRRASDLGGRWAIKFVPDGEASILDISRSGVLLETRSRLAPGSIVDLHLRGIESNLSVAARLLRSEIAAGDGHDVRYRIAAAFSRELELDVFAADLPPSAAVVAHPPRVLGDLLGRVLADATWVSNGSALCERLEAELAGLVRVRAVRIGPAASRPVAAECESMSFAIPGTDNANLALHVLFEPGYQPTPFDVRLLKTAASLAAVVFELAPSARLYSPII